MNDATFRARYAMKKTLFLLILSLSFGQLAAAADVWWHQVPANAAMDNGAVTLLDANGNPVNMVVNPTAAAVQANKGASTQPPTVIVQATTGYWKDPVTNVADLPSSGNSVGDVRMVTSTAKPYMWEGSEWIEQSSDYSGTVSVGNLLVKNVATEGQPCSPNGLVAQNGTGLLLSCQSGRWKKSGGGGRLADMDSCPGFYDARSYSSIPASASTARYVKGMVNSCNGTVGGSATFTCMGGYWHTVDTRYCDSSGNGGH